LQHAGDLLYTADYLRRSALSVLDSHGGQGTGSASDLTVEEFKTNRYDPANDTLILTEAQSAAREVTLCRDSEGLCFQSSRRKTLQIWRYCSLFSKAILGPPVGADESSSLLRRSEVES